MKTYTITLTLEQAKALYDYCQCEIEADPETDHAQAGWEVNQQLEAQGLWADIYQQMKGK